MENNKHISVYLKNDISELTKLGVAITHFCQSTLLEGDVRYHLNLVCEEIFVNNLLHGKMSVEQEGLTIEMSLKEKELLLVLSDAGKEFDPLAVVDPNISGELIDREMGGVGIYLIRKWADEIGYQRTGDKNVLTIIKKLVTAVHP